MYNVKVSWIAQIGVKFAQTDKLNDEKLREKNQCDFVYFFDFFEQKDNILNILPAMYWIILVLKHLWADRQPEC